MALRREFLIVADVETGVVGDWAFMSGFCDFGPQGHCQAVGGESGQGEMRISGDREAFIFFLPTPGFLLLPGQKPSR